MLDLLSNRPARSLLVSVTIQYLRAACPDHWNEEWAKSELDPWPGSAETGTEATFEGCEGSQGMVDCILDEPGTIGYMDSGHGHAVNLPEVALQNEDGVFLTSKLAAEKQGIEAAVEGANTLPSSFDQSFADVSLVNQPGEYTWPVVQLTYVYVRKNLPSFIENDVERALMKAFLRALYLDEFIEPCVAEFGFTPLPASVREKAVNSIGLLQEDGGEPIVWTFEYDTLPVEGAGSYVISSKRRSFGQVERSALQHDAATLQNEVLYLQQEMTRLEDDLTDKLDRKDRQLKAALAMSSIALFLCILAVAHQLRLKTQSGAGSHYNDTDKTSALAAAEEGSGSEEDPVVGNKNRRSSARTQDMI